MALTLDWYGIRLHLRAAKADVKTLNIHLINQNFNNYGYEVKCYPTS